MMDRFGIVRRCGLLGALAVMAPAPAYAGGVQSITIFECGQATTADKSIFSPGIDVGVPYDIPINCYLINHDGELMMGDTGLSDGLIEKPDCVKTAAGKMTIFVKKTLASQMEEIGVSPEDVKHLAFSHMHSDITGNSNRFPNATWYVQEPEYQAAFGKEPDKFRFNPKTYEALRTNKTVKLNGRRDVFGDGSVVIIPAPGHTPGSQVLYVELPSGPVILVGDLWPYESNRENNIMVPKNDFDAEMSRKSMKVVNDLAAETGAKVWINHDRDQSAALPHAPQSIE